MVRLRDSPVQSVRGLRDFFFFVTATRSATIDPSRALVQLARRHDVATTTFVLIMWTVGALVARSQSVAKTKKKKSKRTEGLARPPGAGASASMGRGSRRLCMMY